MPQERLNGLKNMVADARGESAGLEQRTGHSNTCLKIRQQERLGIGYPQRSRREPRLYRQNLGVH